MHLLMLGYFPYLAKQWLPYLQQKAASKSVLAQASPNIVRAWVNRSIPVHPPSPTTPVPGTIWSTSRASALYWPV